MSPKAPQPDNFETDADASSTGGNGIMGGPLLVWSLFGGIAVVVAALIASILGSS